MGPGGGSDPQCGVGFGSLHQMGPPLPSSPALTGGRVLGQQRQSGDDEERGTERRREGWVGVSGWVGVVGFHNTHLLNYKLPCLLAYLFTKG